MIENTYEVSDYYWDHADILRGYGIPENGYDKRIIAFMALKILIDNNKLKFTFDYKSNFNQSKYKGKSSQETLIKIINDLQSFDNTSPYFKQLKKYNNTKSQDREIENCLTLFNGEKVFDIIRYINELDNVHLEMVLDIYLLKANFKNYPKEKYKDLYETTISRMKKLTGELTGQHFTQKSIIELMCKSCIKGIKKNQKIAIYDPACGTGSMLMESYFYIKNNYKVKEIEVYGQEISGSVWMLAKIFLEICDIPNIIAWGNTLTDPAFIEGINGNGSFDLIIANPPFGLDWKHSYSEIVNNMNKLDNSNYYIIKSDKKIAIPRKSDGQFLFILHIIKMMINEKAKGKRANAAIITSSSLACTGLNNTSEAKIRRGIFELGILKAILKQPNAMFTNTDIPTHIWFLDSSKINRKNKKTLKVIKTDYCAKPLYITHPSPIEKMKNTYSKENIYEIEDEINSSRETKYISKKIDLANLFYIDIENELTISDKIEHVDLYKLENEINETIKKLAIIGGLHENY